MVFKNWKSAFYLTLFFSAASLMAAETNVDVSKLPPAAAAQVDFARDIGPIFEKSCLRCHGPEKPRSGFRLDNRVSAIKGGEKGADILPGNSTNSPLIHYVARLAPEMEMPPEDKGEPLTPAQIGLLRAWIDQGAVWNAAAPTNESDFLLSVTGGYTGISGDAHKFREHYWMRDGFNGGVEKFEDIERPNPDTKITIGGHALVNDYKITLDADRNEIGFIHSGWEQYRKYYDDTGGFFNTKGAHLPVSSGQDLFLDNGKAWADFGLTLPDWPRIVFGYEYDYKKGEEATTSWNSDQAAARADPRNIAPSTKHLDEGTHIIKFDFDAEVKGFAIEDMFRGEFYKLNTLYTNLAARSSISQNAHESDHYFQGANSIRLDKQFTSWLYGSGGYFYSKLNATDSFMDNTGNPAHQFFFATVPDIMLERESHVFNLNAMLGPFDGLVLSGGVQSEWTHQEGFGAGILNTIAYTRQPGSTLATNAATLASVYDDNIISEKIGVRYTKIPFTTLFADARLQQEKMGQSDSDLQSSGSFLENPSFSSRMSDLRAGFEASPFQAVSLSAHIRAYDNTSHYNTNEFPQPVGGYPGLISWRDVLTDEVQTKLVVRPCAKLKTTFTYQFLSTDYRSDTRTSFSTLPPLVVSPGGFILAGEYNSHIYSAGTTFTPFRRLALNGTFSYQDEITTTRGGSQVPPYKGNVYSALAGATYIFSESTDLTVSYSLSMGDYAQANPPPGSLTPPPLGITYNEHTVQAALTRRINKHLSTKLQYSYYYYDEPTAAGVNNYKGNAIFGTVTYHFH